MHAGTVSRLPPPYSILGTTSQPISSHHHSLLTWRWLLPLWWAWLVGVSYLTLEILWLLIILVRPGPSHETVQLLVISGPGGEHLTFVVTFKLVCSPRLTPREFNSYGSRRGNDDVMVRGTFANIRLVNKFMAKAGPKTIHIPSG